MTNYELRKTAGLSLVIPALDEEAGIQYTLAEGHRVLQAAGISPYEIVVVDDGSQDGTAEAARLGGATVVRHPHNAGYGRSLKTGILSAKYDTIVISDADGTYPLDRIPDLLRRYSEGFDLVVGERSGAELNDSAIKGPLRATLCFLVEYAVGRKVPDVNSGLRVFSRETVVEHFDHLSNAFSFTTSMTLGYMMRGRFVAYEKIDYRARIGRTKVRLFRESLKTLQYIIQAIIYYNPLKLFLLASTICMALAAITIGFAFVFQVFSGFMLGVGIILVALIVFALGLLADLLRQILKKS